MNKMLCFLNFDLNNLKLEREKAHVGHGKLGFQSNSDNV